MTILEEDQRLMRSWLQQRSLDTKKAWLDFRCNAYYYFTPTGGLEVQIRDLEKSSQWRPWLEVRDNDFWVAQCNNMSIPAVFLLVDLDPLPTESNDGFAQRIEQTREAIIADGGILVSDCTTGSRGRHLEFFVREWAGVPQEIIRQRRLVLLEHYKADLQKASPRCMILVPGMPNPKTGRCKEEVTA